MRGRPAGHRERLPDLRRSEACADNGTGALSVITDFGEEFAIGPAELDAVEAFLLPQLLAILNDDAGYVSADSKPPQKAGQMPELSGGLP